MQEKNEILYNNLDFYKYLFNMVNEGYEVHVVFEPDKTEIEVMPWQPYEFKCPYNNKCNNVTEKEIFKPIF